MKWTYINISYCFLMSGWKLYIYGKSLEDAEYICKHITNICKIYNLTAKIATNEIILRNNKMKPAWGIAVIYLHNSLFNGGLISLLIKNLAYSLRNYNSSGMYNGAFRINSCISCRYDLSISINPAKGMIYSNYAAYYRGEFGNYNITNNSIPSSLISLFN